MQRVTGESGPEGSRGLGMNVLDVLTLQGLALEYCQSYMEGQRKLMLCHHFRRKGNKSVTGGLSS